MITAINTLVKIIYYFSLLLLTILTVISVCSFLNVYFTFGSVPFSEDYTSKLIRDSGKSFNIFPSKIGLKIIITYFYSVLFLIVSFPLILILKHFVTNIEINKKRYLFLIIANFLFFMFWSYTNLIGW